VVCLIALIGIFAVVGIFAALLLSAVQSSRESARQVLCTNNIKQIALAMHSYHDTWGALPPAYTTDEDGNKLHSWRTLLLPFMQEERLYDQIDLNKPWDAPENQHLFDNVIHVYSCPSDPNAGDPTISLPKTSYMVIVGRMYASESGVLIKGWPDEQPLFSEDQPTRFRDVMDGTSNTIMIVEVKGKQVPWGKPTDLTFKEMQMQINGGASPTASPGSGSFHPGGINVGMADGSVYFVAETVDSELLKAMTTRQGWESNGNDLIDLRERLRMGL
jgi:prepilin-type processing-associated H-X9-DG protein